MKTIIISSLLGLVLATSAYAGSAASDLRDLARTASTITVHGFVDGK